MKPFALVMAGCLAALVVQAAPPTPAPTPTFQQLNEAFGLKLWNDDNLWDDKDDEVGKRLTWPEESRTKTQSSYRSYPFQGEKVLGAVPNSLAFYAASGAVAQVSMVFANKGDYAGLFAGQTAVPTDRKELREYQKQLRDKLREFPKALDEDAATIGGVLRQLLGEPRRDRFGQTTTTAERVERWDWKGHAILLATVPEEYIGVRVVPVSVADRAGRIERVLDSVMKARLATNIVTRANGDVVVTNIPVVNQGPKGFCVPATWERYLRYLGLTVDMYVLAMAGQTGMGGGTSLEEMVDGVDNLVQRYGWRLDKLGRSINSALFASTIDKGLPVMWGMYVDQNLNYELTNRAESRQKVTDWEKWLEKLKPKRRAARRMEVDQSQGHMCLIIGYNAKTKEIAISDSWGPEFAERWLTEEEADALSQRELWTIRW